MLGLLLAVLWMEGVFAIVLNRGVFPASRETAMRILKAGLVLSQVLTWALMAGLLRGLLIYAGRRIPRLISSPSR